MSKNEDSITTELNLFNRHNYSSIGTNFQDSQYKQNTKIVIGRSDQTQLFWRNGVMGAIGVPGNAAQFPVSKFE